MIKTRRVIAGALAATFTFALFAVQANAADTPKNAKPPRSKEILEQGRVIYFEKCSFCHGVDGGGDGPAAEFLSPRPRNFKTNVFKLRITASGSLPTDEDMFRTISRGIPGTAMQSFDREIIKTGLTEEQRFAVIYWVQTFRETPDFSLWDLDNEYAKSEDEDDRADYRYNKVIKIGDPPAATEALIARGKEVFKENKCFQCHGNEGRGNGVSAEGMKDDWKFPILPRDLEKSWRYKGGDTVKDIFTRLTTGINGTPMPTFANAIKEDDRWALAYYVKSIQFKPSDNNILEALPLEGELPSTPDDNAWGNASEIDVWLTGNVLIKPRWQNINIDMVKVKAIFNDKEIVFRLEWNDRFPNTIHEGYDELHQLDKSRPGDKGNLQTYVPIYSEEYKPKKYRDAVLLQFPKKLLRGSEKPHFLNGDNSHAVNMWMWRADYDSVKAEIADAVPKDSKLKTIEKYVTDNSGVEKTGPAVIEMNAKGFKKPFTIQPEASQAITSKAVFNDGKWTLVMKRALTTDDKNDIQFARGEFIPLAVNAWDGWNHDIGMMKSISSWYFVYLDKPTPAKVYVITLVAILALIGLQVYLIRLWKKS